MKTLVPQVAPLGGHGKILVVTLEVCQVAEVCPDMDHRSHLQKFEVIHIRIRNYNFKYTFQVIMNSDIGNQ